MKKFRMGDASTETFLLKKQAINEMACKNSAKFFK